MKPGNLLALLLLTVAFAPGSALAGESDEDDARTGAEWLEYMAASSDQVHYSGTYVHSERGAMRTLRVIHRADSEGSQERLISLTGARQEILRDRGKVRCIHEEDQEEQQDLRHTSARFLAQIARDGVSEFEGHYQILDLGQDRVAGRDCHVVGLKPKDDLRYGLRFWIDTETGLPLRTDLVDHEGETRRKVMFTEFQHREEIGDEELKPELDEGQGGYTSRKASFKGRESVGAGDPVELEDWSIKELPEGYRAHAADADGRHNKLHHLIVTDGVARISIFAEPVDENEEVMEGLSRMGTTNAYGRVLNGYQLTVVGEAPAAAVQKIAEAVGQVPEGAGNAE